MSPEEKKEFSGALVKASEKHKVITPEQTAAIKKGLTSEVMSSITTRVKAIYKAATTDLGGPVPTMMGKGKGTPAKQSGGGPSAKPPSGFKRIPGSKNYHKEKPGGGYEYWQP